MRTNYYQRDAAGPAQAVPVLQARSAEVQELPRPRPLFEIFVYAPRVEGIHLRGGGVARGGLRWSDRPEDFRTEILGLMKAQMVKNAVIVPVGSKGGFVVKRPPTRTATRTRRRASTATRPSCAACSTSPTTSCDGAVVPPRDVRRHDGDDPYLVVAADKGTATFSDIANAIVAPSTASGSVTPSPRAARSATTTRRWASPRAARGRRSSATSANSAATPERADFTVRRDRRHVRATSSATACCCSPHTELVAAFDHRHIFVDPDPDPARALAERRAPVRRCRARPGPTTTRSCSRGRRRLRRARAKSITSRPRSRDARASAPTRSPPKLIAAILHAPVDLLYIGGIGTYVKASDRDPRRGRRPRQRRAARRRRGAARAVVGEGGNLGFTQRGRIEYALRGRPASTPTPSTTRPASTPPTTRSTSRSLLALPVADGAAVARQRNELLGR